MDEHVRNSATINDPISALKFRPTCELFSGWNNIPVNMTWKASIEPSPSLGVREITDNVLLSSEIDP